MVTIELEPELEKVAGRMSEDQCRDMARQFYRWSKQLYRKADILASYPPAHVTSSRFYQDGQARGASR
jgi:hypothetical protein